MSPDTLVLDQPENEIKIHNGEQYRTCNYDQSFAISKDYFNGNELAAKVFLDKYAVRDNEGNLVEPSPECMHVRMAIEFTRIEKKKFKDPISYEEILSYFDYFKKIIPQGSILYGLGNDFQAISLSNCFVLESPIDSYGGIHRTDEQLSQVSKRRGGCGLDISNLRPNHTPTKNAAMTSTGIIPFMERYSTSIREVGQNGRRGALMITMSVHHPEVVEFAKVKRDKTKVTGANLSIRLTDEFLNAVEKDEMYEQRWPVDSKDPKTSKQVRAKDVWNEIIDNAWYMAEPGLLFWDNILRESPADCYAEYGYETISTNPCSELPLSYLDSCRLLLLNLFSYVKNPFKRNAYFDFEEFHHDTMIAQRLMDDLIDLELEKIEQIITKIENDPESDNIKKVEREMWEKVHHTCKTGRRTGCGITALGDAIAAVGLKYGSQKSIDFTDKVYKTLKLAAYRSSVEMAKELGPFDVWDHNLEKDCPFIKRIKDEDEKLWKDMKKYGRRNIALLTTAPAGSVSLLAKLVNQYGSSSGIEPQFSILPYTRKKKINPNDENAKTDEVDQSGDHWQHFDVYAAGVQDWMDISGQKDIEKSPWWGCCAEDIDWKQRVKLQAAAQRHVDHGISSTLNLPEDVTKEKVAEIYEAAWKSGAKGITVYRKGCRTGVMVDKPKSVRNGNTIHKTQAPKRPKKLDAELHFTRVKGEHYFVIVGSLHEHDDPYEIFIGNNGFVLKRGSIEGSVVREKRGVYHGCFGEDIEIRNISTYCSDEEESLTRMISTALRHGADVSFIVHQLEKTRGDLTGVAKALVRVLKKYVKEGCSVTGEECPACKSDLTRSEGCVSCKNCGWSKC